MLYKQHSLNQENPFPDYYLFLNCKVNQGTLMYYIIKLLSVFFTIIYVLYFTII